MIYRSPLNPTFTEVVGLRRWHILIKLFILKSTDIYQRHEMCVNFRPVTQEKLKRYFDVEAKNSEGWKAETWQDYAAPIIVGGQNGRRALVGIYSIIPKKFMLVWVKRYTTMNARAETIGTLRSYAAAWRQCQFCLCLCWRFLSQIMNLGKQNAGKINRADGEPIRYQTGHEAWRHTCPEFYGICPGVFAGYQTDAKNSQYQRPELFTGQKQVL